MALPLPKSYAPMNALLVDDIPVGDQWQYEPKWDGFRCIAFRDGASIDLQSKNGQPLSRYFPEMVESLAHVSAKRFVLDGELVIPQGRALSFDALLQRIHPAATRIRRLSEQTPAIYIVFDLLVDESGASLVDRPLRERRRALEAFASKHLRGNDRITLSPSPTISARPSGGSAVSARRSMVSSPSDRT
jgi:ATP-dependent DNA ligase